jgi:hypothetical protein
MCRGRECSNPVKYSLIYQCGDSSDQELTLCKSHYDSDPVFRRHIKNIEEIECSKENLEVWE